MVLESQSTKQIHVFNGRGGTAER